MSYIDLHNQTNIMSQLLTSLRSCRPMSHAVHYCNSRLLKGDSNIHMDIDADRILTGCVTY